MGDRVKKIVFSWKIKFHCFLPFWILWTDHPTGSRHGAPGRAQETLAPEAHLCARPCWWLAQPGRGMEKEVPAEAFLVTDPEVAGLGGKSWPHVDR